MLLKVCSRKLLYMPLSKAINDQKVIRHALSNGQLVVYETDGRTSSLSEAALTKTTLNFLDFIDWKVSFLE